MPPAVSRRSKRFLNSSDEWDEASVTFVHSFAARPQVSTHAVRRFFLVVAGLAVAEVGCSGPSRGVADGPADASGADSRSPADAPAEDDASNAARDATSDGGATDAGLEDAGDASGFPAFHPAVPQVISLGGPVLTTPRIVAVLFAGDPLEADIRSFVQEILENPGYWSQATSEYGVGALAATSTLVAQEAPPASATSDEVQAWLASHLDGAHAGWEAFDPQTMYTVFYPSQTQLTLTGLGAQCQAFGGYHLDAPRSDGGAMFYAAIPRCPTIGGISEVDLMTSAASHEWAEGAADPHPTSDPAYFVTDAAHIAWGRFVLR